MMAMARKKMVEELHRASLPIRILLLLPLSLLCFYIGKHWATRYEQLLLLNDDPSSSSPSGPFVLLVDESRNPPPDLSYGILIDPSTIPATNISHSPASPPPSPPPPLFRFTGILNDDGTLRQEFSGDEEEITESDDASESEMLAQVPAPKEEAGTVKTYKFEVCQFRMQDYIPCLDNVAAIKLLPSKARGEQWERHCPQHKRNRFSCLIPAPRTWRNPVLWPRSRDEIFYGNVPHPRLANDKAGQNWMTLKKDKFTFPGGGTQFPHGADHYLDQMAKMVPDIAFGVHTRVALDIGCGVASWGAYLLSRNVLTLSIAPKDVHENQIQFALERGVPAMVAALATHRLLYPSQAFDLIHCSRCRIEWTRDEGILLLEVDRILRAGGYFAWAAQPVYKHEAKLPEIWHEMEDLGKRLCWKLVAKEGYIAIWQKPVDNICYYQRAIGTKPPVCDKSDDPDSVWYIPLKACITLLPESVAGNNVSDWPARLHIPPYRIQHVMKDAIAAKEEVFIAKQHYWDEIVAGYLRGLGLKKEKFRNVMDMNAGYGVFAAALLDQNVDWWVMNVVPVSGPNTLPVIYDRGLIGVAHDWCEAFDTYPRTYDLLHVAGLFTQEEKRCDIAHIVVEMDRILRPDGWVLVRDSYEMVKKVEAIAKLVRWETRLLVTDSGPFGKDRLLSCKKQLWRA